MNAGYRGLKRLAWVLPRSRTGLVKRAVRDWTGSGFHRSGALGGSFCPACRVTTLHTDTIKGEGGGQRDEGWGLS